MDQLRDIFDKKDVIIKGGKNFLILPLFNHSEPTSPQILQTAVNAVIDVIDWRSHNKITTIVSEEESGGFLAVCVALQRNIPFTLAKQNPFHIPGEISIKFAMSYNSEMTLHLNGVRKGENVVLIEDFIDSGGTMIALIQALQIAGATISDIVALGEKVNAGGVKRVKKETGYDVKTIVRVDTSKKKSKVISTIFD